MGSKTRQTRGKAVKRALTTLPTILSKRAEVLQLLRHSLTLISRKRVLTPETVTRKSKPIDDTLRMVEDFLQNDVNLWAMPGKKDGKAGIGLKKKTGKD